MSDIDAKELIRTLTFCLEVALPYLDRQAADEKAREANSTLRKITKQQRAKAAKQAVATGYKFIGMVQE